MHSSHPSRSRRREVALAPELLETRQLLTGGTGSTFALITGTIAKAGQDTALKFTIDPSHFTIPKGGFTLGIDVAQSSGSSVTPQIVAVDNSAGRPQKLTHGHYAAGLPNSTIKAGAPTSAVLMPVHISPGATTTTYTVMVKGTNNTTGGFLLGFYLPGDANGDGTVSQADINTIKAELGVKASSSTTSKYNFDADVNRDGRITSSDLKVAEQNLGVTTTVTPVVSAQLDPASQGPIKDGALIGPQAHFTGVATPGAKLTFAEINNLVPPTSTTANSAGNYSIVVPVAAGTDTFRVTTSDAFGQSVSGTLSPVTYAPTTTTTS
jgi:hypothetical protein